MRVVFCGDIVPTEATLPAFDAGDLKTLFGETLTPILKADFAVANLECALTDTEGRIRKCGPNLKGRPEHAEVLKKAGFTHIGLSNNHVFDFGLAGLRDTTAALEKAGLTYFGIGEDDQDSRKPVFLEKDGKTLAIIAVCEHEYSYALPDRPGSNPFDPFDTIEDIEAAAAKADYVAVMYHGGKEQCEYPSPRLRKACRAMVRAGADLIMCQHSHCIGCAELYDKGVIVYGQGNFNFVAHPEHPHWRTGLMLDVDFAEKRVDFLPVKANASGVELAGAQEASGILDAFAQRGITLLDDQAWHKAWEDFCHSMPYYIDAVRNAYVDVPEGEACRQVFPHYLDCEAHLDVWQTIYPTWHREKTDDPAGV